MKYDYIIFDFNGTILDDLELCIMALNKLCKDRNIPLVNKTKYKEVFGFPVVDYYKKVGFDFSKESFDGTAVEFMDIYNSNWRNCKLSNGFIEFANDLLSKKQKMVILSASNLNNMMQQLNYFDIVKYFDKIMGLNDNLATSKTQIALDWINSFENKPKLLFLGDTIHDYEVATILGADCILISQTSHQSKRRLVENTNAIIVNTFKDIYKYLD